MQKISNFKNSKNLPNFNISKIIKFLKLFNFEEKEFFKILLFRKVSKFSKFPIS